MARGMPEPRLSAWEKELDLCSPYERRQYPGGRGADAKGSAEQEEECTVHIAICGYCTGEGRCLNRVLVINTYK